MAKDDNGGLLSKVVRFVRNPTTNWSDLDQQESDRESTYSKQMLKEMIERKRRNDFVRKREFDMLRKLRRSEVMAGQDPGARPSFFQSSIPSKPDDRAMTLKKIDEIEAQMSMQWWKTKHGDSSLRSSNFPVSTSASKGPSTQPPHNAVSTQQETRPPGPAKPLYGTTEPSPLPTAKVTDAPQAGFSSTLPPDLPAAPVRSLAPPQQAVPRPPVAATPTMRPEPPAMVAPVRVPVAGSSPPAKVLQGHYEGGTTTGFSASKLYAIDVDEFAHDPELEEASIRFANGDDRGAEAGLLEVLSPQGARIDHEETWMTLFDLYRATSQQDRFESAAIDFAGRFGRSAPQWFSIPEAVGRMKAPASNTSSAGGGAQVADWICPGSLGSQTLAALNAALAKAPQPWRLNWSKLTQVEESAVEPLTRLFSQWGAQPVQLRFMGAEALDKALQSHTESGNRNVNPGYWRLRMEVLRVMHRPDEFELVALDYCVTYEVSPPSWESARCEFKPLQSDGSYVAGHTIIGEAFRDSIPSSVGSSEMDTQMASMGSQMTNVSVVELAGQILGDATEALATLESRLLGADIMVISCARLIRIDFSAAGTLLNWVTARQSEGRQVQFSEVHRLVAAFFNVIGISEHARVIPRID